MFFVPGHMLTLVPVVSISSWPCGLSNRNDILSAMFIGLLAAGGSLVAYLCEHCSGGHDISACPELDVLSTGQLGPVIAYYKVRAHVQTSSTLKLQT
jgi:hypothetical protein